MLRLSYVFHLVNQAHKKPESQNLFGIVQGGLDCSPGGLREVCLKGMIDRDMPGYAIGGLAGGESKDSFWRVVAQVFFLTVCSWLFALYSANILFYLVGIPKAYQHDFSP